MAVVVLIMITAALAAPGLMRTMSAERAQRATFDLARLAREARSESISFGRAYLLRVDTDATTGGSMELWRGVTDSCRFNRWSDIVVEDGCQSGTRAADCVDAVDLASYTVRQQRVQVSTGTGPRWICFEPDDEIWVGRDGDDSPSRLDAATEAVTLTIQRFDGTTGLEQRRLVIPISGAPRVM